MDLTFLGTKHTITLPSGRIVKIRETNGDDDAILSKVSSVKKDENIQEFLVNIIEEDGTIGRKPLMDELMEWHRNDIYYLLFKQRLINQGNILKFKSKCQNEQCADKPATEFEFDLDVFDWDLSKPQPTNGESKNANDYRVVPYPNKGEAHVNVRLASGKLVQFKNMSLRMDKNSLDFNDRDQNSILLMRDIKIKRGEEWEPLKFFKEFSSKEMTEIRTAVKVADRHFNPHVDYTCPNCNQFYIVDLYSVPSFLFPENGI